MIINIEKRFLNYIKQNKLIENGEGIVVGLSGGPDSVCLLNLLCSIKEEMNLQIAAAHVNHMIRREEADKDQEYAKHLCETLNVKFFELKTDVEKFASENRLSSETAGRDIRYSFFNEIKDKLGYSKIATAHNANDQAETILMRVMRGTGLEGLGGIPVKREEKYIRPILFMKREEVEEYCKIKSLKPRIDATNLEKLYSRNKVRLDILPYMRENFNEDVVEAINRMALLLQYDNEFILDQVEVYYRKYCKEYTNKIFIAKDAFECSFAIVTRIIRRAIKEVSKDLYNVEMKHINEVISLQKLGTNKVINLPLGLIAENIYGDIYIKVKEEKKIVEKTKIILDKEGISEKMVRYGKYELRFKVIDNNRNVNFKLNKNIKYFNYDKINGNIIIRQRKNGDKMIPLGMNSNKKIKDIFINMKIPKEERDNTPIVELGEDIAWLVPIKVSDKYKVTKDTKKILQIKCEIKE